MLHSLIPLSLLLSFIDSCVYGVHLPVQIRTSNQPRTLSTFGRRAANTTIPVGNYGNAQYFANITIAGEQVAVLLDTGSSDLWVNFPDKVPQTTNSGESLTLSYAIGSAAGSIVSAKVEFYDYTINSQAFLLVTDTSSFSTDIHSQGYDGLLGLGPNEGSRILDEIDEDSANTFLTNIFTQTNGTDNFITFLLDRKADPSEDFSAQLTLAEYVKGYEKVSEMPKIDVETVHRLLQSEQHWQGLTDKDNGVIGPDGQIILIDSIVPKAPDGQLVAVFDSGFTFTQVPRDLADAIYGRVQGAVYDSKKEWWTVPCGQLLNITFNFGGQSYPVHPMDTVDDNFNIKNANGTRVCIGSFQPITSAFSLLGNYDMIMGMNFLRNVYTKLDFGSWSGSNDDANDPYIQLLSITDVNQAHSDFVTVRLGGSDTTGDAKWQLLPTSEMQHSPVSEEEKKKKYQEMVLSRWPYILTGCLAAVLIIVGIVCWRCCCRRNKDGSKGAMCCHKRAKATIPKFTPSKGSDTSYLPLQDQHSMHNASTTSLSYDQNASYGDRYGHNSGYSPNSAYDQYGGGGHNTGYKTY
ncbi:aspartic peptidase domain-containing protein [Mucidula mucida]|nr:aspartic peptidase domain-containing protein [Mucidula mucida]